MTLPYKHQAAVPGDVVVCRPEQFREAAVVLSSLPATPMTPLVVVDHAPCTFETHWRRTAELRAHVDDMIRESAAADLEVRIPDPTERQAFFEAAQERERELVLSVLPYRRWLKHKYLVSHAVAGLGCRRAVFLFDPSPLDLAVLDPAADDEGSLISAMPSGDAPAPVTGRGRSLFGDLEQVVMTVGTQQLSLHPGTLHAEGLEELSTLVQEVFGARPGPTLEVAVNGGVEHYVRALYTALREGAVLRPVACPGETATARFEAASRGVDGHDAVLVDDLRDSRALLAAAYACHTNTPLVIAPQPDLSKLRGFIGEDGGWPQPAVSDSESQAGGDSPPAGAKHSLERGWVQDAVAHFLILRIQQIVTAQVPAEVIEAVGARRLTAFTIGLPYSFVCTKGHDWSRKPIGHVVAAPDLIILNELLAEKRVGSGVAFNLVVDPGFFPAVTEADDVAAASGAHGHGLMLTGERASYQVLHHLGYLLPVELVFFITHGNRHGIELHGGLMSSQDITRFSLFDRHPVIFNNSCQSFAGVGRDFILSGARSYVGTLWKVDARLAADYARAVVQRASVAGESVSEALISTELPARITRAYIHVGTARSRLSLSGVGGRGAEELYACLLAALVKAARIRGAGEMRGTAPDLLYPDLVVLRRGIRSENAVPGVRGVSLMLGQLDLLADVGYLARKHFHDDSALADDIRADADRLGTQNADLAIMIKFSVAVALAKIHRHRSETDLAIREYETAISIPAGSRAERAPVFAALAELCLEQGRHARALSFARLGNNLYRRVEDEKARTGFLRLVALARRLEGQAAEALAALDEAIGLATRIGAASEQAGLLLERARLSRERGYTHEAVEDAEKALLLYKSSLDVAGQLSATGELGRLHLAAGNDRSAEVWARQGVVLARRRGEPLLEVGFALDHAEAAASGGKWQRVADWSGTALTLAEKSQQWSTAVRAYVLHCRARCALRQVEQLDVCAWRGLLLSSKVSGDLEFLVATHVVASATRFGEIVGAIEFATLAAKLVKISETLEKMAGKALAGVGMVRSRMTLLLQLAACPTRDEALSLAGYIDGRAGTGSLHVDFVNAVRPDGTMPS